MADLADVGGVLGPVLDLLGRSWGVMGGSLSPAGQVWATTTVPITSGQSRHGGSLGGA